MLQFDQASVTTVGVLVGLMFLGVGIENLALARLDVPMRWAWALFGGVFLVSAVVCFANPTDTFAGLADMLGFLFLIVGVWWMVRAFVERAVNPLWWTGLISGILMTGLAFWTSGQFFIHKAYVLLVVAGIWALIQGVTSIVRAFEHPACATSCKRLPRGAGCHAARPRVPCGVSRRIAPGATGRARARERRPRCACARRAWRRCGACACARCWRRRPVRTRSPTRSGCSAGT